MSEANTDPSSTTTTTFLLGVAVLNLLRGKVVDSQEQMKSVASFIHQNAANTSVIALQEVTDEGFSFPGWTSVFSRVKGGPQHQYNALLFRNDVWDTVSPAQDDCPIAIGPDDGNPNLKENGVFYPAVALAAPHAQPSVRIAFTSSHSTCEGRGSDMARFNSARHRILQEGVLKLFPDLTHQCHMADGNYDCEGTVMNQSAFTPGLLLSREYGVRLIGDNSWPMWRRSSEKIPWGTVSSPTKRTNTTTITSTSDHAAFFARYQIGPHNTEWRSFDREDLGVVRHLRIPNVDQGAFVQSMLHIIFCPGFSSFPSIHKGWHRGTTLLDAVKDCADPTLYSQYQHVQDVSAGDTRELAIRRSFLPGTIAPNALTSSLDAQKEWLEKFFYPLFSNTEMKTFTKKAPETTVHSKPLLTQTIENMGEDVSYVRTDCFTPNNTHPEMVVYFTGTAAAAEGTPPSGSLFQPDCFRVIGGVPFVLWGVLFHNRGNGGGGGGSTATMTICKAAPILDDNSSVFAVFYRHYPYGLDEGAPTSSSPADGDATSFAAVCFYPGGVWYPFAAPFPVESGDFVKVRSARNAVERIGRVQFVTTDPPPEGIEGTIFQHSSEALWVASQVKEAEVDDS